MALWPRRDPPRGSERIVQTLDDAVDAKCEQEHLSANLVAIPLKRK